MRHLQGIVALTSAAIALLFLLHGARLPRESLIHAVKHRRLLASSLSVTFSSLAVRDIVGVTLLWPELPAPKLWLGILFLSALPSTVQVAIAFTWMAQGNITATATSAVVSNLFGIAQTPLLVGLLTHAYSEAVSSSVYGRSFCSCCFCRSHRAISSGHSSDRGQDAASPPAEAPSCWSSTVRSRLPSSLASGARFPLSSWAAMMAVCLVLASDCYAGPFYVPRPLPRLHTGG